MSAFPRRIGRAVGFVAAAALVARAAADEPVDYNRDVRPILSDRCFACHGPDKKQRKGDLPLDDRADALAQEGIVPGKLDQSELGARIESTDPDEMMPPKSMNKPLSADQVETLKRWVAQGAPYAAHWAYTPLKRPAVPSPKRADTVRNPVDAFI